MRNHPFLFTMPLSLALGLAIGASMFRDLFLFRRTALLLSFVLLIVSGMVLFKAARLSGLPPLYPFPLLHAPTAANVVGGFLFGVGMVLTVGCGCKGG